MQKTQACKNVHFIRLWKGACESIPQEEQEELCPIFCRWKFTSELSHIKPFNATQYSELSHIKPFNATEYSLPNGQVVEVFEMKNNTPEGDEN
jgi:hypothetical protein